jgi:hypothetical protein
MATEDGCKGEFASLQLLWSLPALSPARYFFSESERNVAIRNSRLKELLSPVNEKIFIRIEESHKWRKSSGVLDRVISIVCGGPLVVDKNNKNGGPVVISKYSWS